MLLFTVKTNNCLFISYIQIFSLVLKHLLMDETNYFCNHCCTFHWNLTVYLTSINIIYLVKPYLVVTYLFAYSLFNSEMIKRAVSPTKLELSCVEIYSYIVQSITKYTCIKLHYEWRCVNIKNLQTQITYVLDVNSYYSL